MNKDGVVKIQPKYEKKYKCPYCENRLIREKLVSHIENKHDEMIPEGYTSTRVVFNLINKKTHGSCIICGEETKWNEDKARYERLCDKKSCMQKYKEMTAERLFKKYNKTKEDFLNDPEFQNKMLANRTISGKYKFSDGGVINYVGSYEKKFLEFMDKFFHVSTKDLIAPGPIIDYQFKGKTHKWITDFYYEPYNLVFDVKDGGDNPNNREMSEYREKQNAKEKAIASLNQYNYIRLTNNQFDQMILLMMELKDSLMETQYDVNKKHIIRVNEGYIDKNIDTVIFDIGSVLVQQTPLEVILRNEDSYIPESLIDDLVKIWCSSGTETCTIDEQIITSCKKAYESGLQGPMKQYFTHIAEASLLNIHTCDYTIPMLEKLKENGYKLYILSNWGKWHFERLREINKFGFLSYFDGGIVSYQVGLQKPDTRIYEMLIDKYNIVPSSAIFFDDKSENVQAAKDVGLNAVVFDRFVADTIINSSDVSCPYNINETTKLMRKELYFLSINNLDGETLHPRIPSNYFTDNGYEEDKTPRVSFAPSIDQCLMGLSQNLKNKEFYVHIPFYDQSLEMYKPTQKEVPDCRITGEVWVKDDVKINCIGKIKVLKDKDLPGHKFKYGDTEGELYEWDWKWIERSKIPLNEAPSTLDPNHKRKVTDKKFKFMDLNNPNIDKYLKQNRYCMKFYDYIHNDCKGEIVIDVEEDTIAGYVFIDDKKYPGFITPLEVIKKYRGYGLGSKLLKHAITKYGAIDLCVDKDNQIAIKLYKDNGFVIIGDGNSEKQYYMKLRSKLKKSEIPKIVEESMLKTSNSILNQIIEFNDRLNQYEYIIANDNKIITKITLEDFAKYYRHMNPEEFEKYNGGICWDYVMYEANWFSKNIPSIKFKTYFVEFETGNNPTHTFLLFFLNGKCYWFESSWKNHIGIYEFKNEDDALSYIIKEIKPSGTIKSTFIVEYDATDINLYGMNMSEYCEHMSKISKKYYKKTNAKPLSIMKGELRCNDTPYELAIEESKVLNKEDIYYNKDKFDSGEINLCFITGHSGSGKSTMARNLQSDNVEHYELDDLQCVKDHFTMNNLKEYGDLIYSYFNGRGKKFYITHKELVDNNIPGSEYEDILFKDFVHYAMGYAKSHKNKKFIIEGVWIFCTGDDGKPWFTPEEFKDYAFCIKGTSMIISKHRAALRDAKNDFGDNKFDIAKSYLNNFVRKNWKWYFVDEKRINVFRNYFTKIMKESSIFVDEFVSSSIIDDYNSKQDMRLNQFTKITLSDAIIQVHKQQHSTLSHVRINKNTKGFAWLDNNKLVAIINTEKKDDDYVWINAFEIFDPYKGHGLARQILRIAIKELAITHLSVNKNNKIAYELYKKYGFKVYKETEKMYFMRIKK